MNFLQQHAAKGQVVTGLLYVDREPEDLHRHLNTVDAPLNALSREGAVPGLGGARQDQRRPALVRRHRAGDARQSSRIRASAGGIGASSLGRCRRYRLATREARRDQSTGAVADAARRSRPEWPAAPACVSDGADRHAPIGEPARLRDGRRAAARSRIRGRHRSTSAGIATGDRRAAVARATGHRGTGDAMHWPQFALAQSRA